MYKNSPAAPITTQRELILLRAKNYFIGFYEFFWENTEGVSNALFALNTPSVFFSILIIVDCLKIHYSPKSIKKYDFGEE